tara:strand:+ start:88 stop:246 length:159 start_codon:yes stop_codon:yes gene_type:complete
MNSHIDDYIVVGSGSVQVNARSFMAKAGKLATKELLIWEFQRFLSTRLCSKT